MPELPEVETVRRGLCPALEHRQIVKAAVRRRDLRRPFPPHLAERLTGRTVLRLRRRAKYLLADLDSGETLVIHLGMSGRMSVYAKGRPRRLGGFLYGTPPTGAGTGKHDHVVLETDAPALIVFTDHRRFGLMTLVDTGRMDADPLFAGLGIEPLSPGFDGAFLAKALKGRKAPIKSALLDQRIVAGLGNIYVCEALFRAGISPKRPAGAIAAPRLAGLAAAIRNVLQDAIAAGGSTLRDHAQATGDPGHFQHQFLVYGHQGAPCRRKACHGTVRRIVQAGRSTFYCAACQT